MPTAPYAPRRHAAERLVVVRDLRYHLLEWGDESLVRPSRPTLVMAHGWMDVGASFQFVVDALGGGRHVIAFDWRGFGSSDATRADAYWFADYLGDLDALLDIVSRGRPVDLLGHSMGGNVAMIYAGVRPARIRRLVNLEGYGLPETAPEQAPDRYAQWLDELKATQRMPDYASLAQVAARLARDNPRLGPDKAAWLAPHRARRQADGRWQLNGDPLHRRVNPVLYRKDEVLACWKRIAAPVLFVEGDSDALSRSWAGRYPRSDFEARLALVLRLERCRLADCGHMLHHDQPEALAAAVAAFIDRD